MEINNHIDHFTRKDLPGSSPLTSPIMSHRVIDPGVVHQPDLFLLKQHQQIQQLALAQRFQEEQQRLALQHEKQMHDHVQIGSLQQMILLKKQHEFAEEQKKAEEQRIEQQVMAQEKIQQIKNKQEEEQSAVASSAVKQKLAEFVLNKKQREVAGRVGNTPAQYRHWGAHHSVDQPSHTAGLSPPYRPPFGLYDDDFPLRKTASEPNLKVRTMLKQKVIDRRSSRGSPLLKRRPLGDKVSNSFKSRKPPLASSLSLDTPIGNSTTDNGHNSPPTNNHHQPHPAADLVSRLHANSEEQLPIHMLRTMMGQSQPDLTLYTSPSMPNISMGRPPSASHASPVSQSEEADLRARAAARHGLPLTGHMMPNTLPFYHPSLSVINSEQHPMNSKVMATAQLQAAAIHPALIAHYTAQAQAQAQAQGSVGPVPPMAHSTSAITSNEVAHARLHSHGHGHRPLSRTRSAPLPIGHPLLTAPPPHPHPSLHNNPLLLQQHQHQQQQQQQHQAFIKENQKHYLKQHIRATVLQRTSNKNLMENVDEETEAKLAQEMREERDDQEEIVVIDKDDEELPGQSSPLSPPDGVVHDLSQNGLNSSVHKTNNEEALNLSNSKLNGSEVDVRKDSSIHRNSAMSDGHIPHRPLARTQSSPLVTFSLPPRQDCSENASTVKLQFTTGLAYDGLMLKHQCSCMSSVNHPEHEGRLQSIWARLQERNLVTRCEKVKSRKATIDELQTCHSEPYTLLYGTSPFHRQKLDAKILEGLPLRFCMLPCGGVGVDSDTVWNDLHTSQAARMATGCVIELAFKVALGELRNGFALVRPPGHHAEVQQAMGFCFFNSIAITAKLLREKLKLNKIMVLDWDVHHGNGTQQMLYDDPNILYVSIHRHDDGHFFPGTGAPEECGQGAGTGFNVNISWSGGLDPPMGDAEYMAAFRSVVMPITRDFKPDLILVSAGFDATDGHPAPLGGYKITPTCFGHMTKQLMIHAEGKVVLALEGGYDLPSICDATEMCIKALLGDEIPPLKDDELMREPSKPALETLQNTIEIQGAYWPNLRQYGAGLHYSLLEVQKREQEEKDTVAALASMAIVTGRRSEMSESSQESEPMEET